MSDEPTNFKYQTSRYEEANHPTVDKYPEDIEELLKLQMHRDNVLKSQQYFEKAAAENRSEISVIDREIIKLQERRRQLVNAQLANTFEATYYEKAVKKAEHDAGVIQARIEMADLRAAKAAEETSE